jgi:diguanylate cyclase (GGDEF)-like protein/PAS domain S-box-containing protein
MALRRCSTLLDWLGVGLQPLGPNLLTEIIALTSSGLMVIGLSMIGPIFRNFRRLSEENLSQSEQKYSLLARHVPGVIFKGYSDGAADFFDDKVAELVGYQKEIFNSRRIKWTDLLLEEDLPYAKATFVKALKTNRFYVREYRIKHGAGKIVWVQERSQIICDNSGNIDHISGVFFDVTVRREAEEALQHSKEELTSWVQELEKRNQELTLLSEMGDMLQSCAKAEEAYKIISSFLKQIFQEDAGALLMLETPANLLRAVSVWGGYTVKEEVIPREQCWAFRTGRLYGASAYHPDICDHQKDDTDNFLCVPMMAQGEALGVLHWQTPSAQTALPDSKKRLVVTVAEHMALALANLKLRDTLHHQSIRDSLTGLYNRRHLDEALTLEIYRATRNNQPLGLILFDIDHFKKFNDTFGHDAGDTVLRELGEFLQERTRKTDVVCRYGGEEFLIIMPAASLETTTQRAEQLREQIKLLNIMHQGKSIGKVTISVGVTAIPENGNSAKTLIKIADEALYQAKAEGRDRTVRGQSMEDKMEPKGDLKSPLPLGLTCGHT